MHLVKYHFYNPKNYLYSKPVKGFRNFGVSYCFAFNGKEKDNEGMGGGGSTYDYGFRIYNAQLGKFLSVDPLTNSYPWNSTFAYAENDVIRCIDLDGLEKWIINDIPQTNGDIIRTYDYDPNRRPLEKKDKNDKVISNNIDYLYKEKGRIVSSSEQSKFNTSTDLSAMKLRQKLGKGESFIVIRKVNSEDIVNQVENNTPSVEPETPFSPDIVVTNKNVVIPEDKPKNLKKTGGNFWVYEGLNKSGVDYLFNPATGSHLANLFQDIESKKGKITGITLTVIENNTYSYLNQIILRALQTNKKVIPVLKVDKDWNEQYGGRRADFGVNVEYEIPVKR